MLSGGSENRKIPGSKSFRRLYHRYAGHTNRPLTEGHTHLLNLHTECCSLETQCWFHQGALFSTLYTLSTLVLYILYSTLVCNFFQPTINDFLEDYKLTPIQDILYRLSIM